MWPQAILERATDREGKPLRDRLKVGRGVQVLRCSAERVPLRMFWGCPGCAVTRGLRHEVSGLKVHVLQSMMEWPWRAAFCSTSSAHASVRCQVWPKWCSGQRGVRPGLLCITTSQCSAPSC